MSTLDFAATRIKMLLNHLTCPAFDGDVPVTGNTKSTELAPSARRLNVDCSQSQIGKRWALPFFSLSAEPPCTRGSDPIKRPQPKMASKSLFYL